MLKFAKGDLFESGADILVNAVNCRGAMGKGLALEFKRRFPEMFRGYKTDCAAGRVRVGEMHIWCGEGAWIINFPTKDDWRDPSRLSYVKDGMKAIAEYLEDKGRVTVAMPMLGCGCGGLDNGAVRALMEKYLGGCEAEVIVYEF